MNKLWGLVFFLILLNFSCNNHKTPGSPNIILINIDDLGWKDLSYQGSQFYETPNIDKLAREGMTFTNGYAAASNCAPSRACLMTGLWSPRHGIYTVNSSARGNSKHRKIIPTENTTTLDTNCLTLSRILKQNGYATCHAGKWHLSEDPLQMGFDINIGGGHNGHPKSYFPPYKNVNLHPENGEYLTDYIMTKTIDFLQTAQQPFFLNYSPYAVHTPIIGVDSLNYKYDNKPTFEGQGNIAYATMIDNLDRNIGLLIQNLLKLDILKNTFIIFTSDNGGLYGITRQLPLRAGKGSYYEGGIRVPFIFYREGEIPKNIKNDTPISNLDILPTILELTNIQTSIQPDGKSLLPVLKAEKDLETRPLFWHFPIYLQAYQVHDNQNRDSLFRTRPGSVVRMGDWKLHHYFEDDEIELYNLKEDISEQNELSGLHSEKANELLNLLDDWRKKTNAPIPKKLNPDFEL